MLRPSQQKVLEYIRSRSAEGLPPTVREICSATGLRSTSSVAAIRRELEDMGYIERDGGSSRGIRLRGSSRSVNVPLVGTVTAGMPILAEQNIDGYMPFPAEQTRGREIFALRVQGMSMRDAGILDGDIIYAERVETAENGQIVVALIDDEATVKRFYREDGHFRLQPENDSFEPILVDSLSILGRVISVFRLY